jgi:hypothetical protein
MQKSLLIVIIVLAQISPLNSAAELRSRIRKKVDLLAAELVKGVSPIDLWALGEQFAISGRVRAGAALMEDALLNRTGTGTGTGIGAADLVSMRVKAGNYLRQLGCPLRALRQYRYPPFGAVLQIDCAQCPDRSPLAGPRCSMLPARPLCIRTWV